MRNRWPWLILPLLAAAPSRAADRPVLTFEKEAVVVSGLTAGETVAWLGVERLLDEEFSSTLVHRTEAITVAADGTSRLELGREPALRSIWVAVEIKSGELLVATPEGYRLRKPDRPSRLDARGDAEADAIEDDRAYLMGLVVRPGEGAWSFIGADGSEGDADREVNGRQRLELDFLEPLPGSPPPPRKAIGKDLWFVVDPQRMEIAVHKGGVAQ